MDVLKLKLPRHLNLPREVLLGGTDGAVTRSGSGLIGAGQAGVASQLLIRRTGVGSDELVLGPAKMGVLVRLKASALNLSVVPFTKTEPLFKKQ